MSHSGRNVDSSGNVDTGTSRGLLTSDTSVVTYGQETSTRTAEQSSASRAERAGLPSAVGVANLAQGLNVRPCGKQRLLQDLLQTSWGEIWVKFCLRVVRVESQNTHDPTVYRYNILRRTNIQKLGQANPLQRSCPLPVPSTPLQPPRRLQ